MPPKPPARRAAPSTKEEVEQAPAPAPKPAPRAAAPRPAAAAAAAPTRSKPTNPVAQSNAVSMDPDDFTSGLLQDGEYVISDACFTGYDFNGKADSPRLMLAIQYVNRENRFQIDYLGLGGSMDDPIENHFEQSPDGSRLLRREGGTKPTLNRQCKAARFLSSLAEAFRKAGLQKPGLNGDTGIRALVGTGVYLTRLVLPKSEDERFQRKSGEPPSVMVVDHLIEPFEYEPEPEAQPAPAAASKSAAKEGANLDNATEEELSDAVIGVMDIVAGKDGGVAVAQLVRDAFNHFRTNPNKQRLVQLVNSSEFLKTYARPSEDSDEGYWFFDGSTVTGV